MQKESLTSDCSKCHALCCVALAFDKSSLFAIDKAAGVPCPNLDHNFNCSIHDDLQKKGFQGCINYDCAGAGQRVCQQIFPDKNWQDDPGHLVPMLGAFQGMRHIHEQLLLLNTARSLDLSQTQHKVITSFEDRLQKQVAPESQAMESIASNPIDKEIQAFLKSLAPLLDPNFPKTPDAP